MKGNRDVKNLFFAVCVLAITMISSATVQASLTATSLSGSQVAMIEDPNQGFEEGLQGTIDAGGYQTTPEFGLGAVYQNSENVDVGQWIWNSSYPLTWLNNGGGAFTLTIGSFVTDVYRPTDSFEDTAIILQGNWQGSAIELDNVVVTTTDDNTFNIGNLKAGPADGQDLDAVLLHGTSIKEIQATFIPVAGFLQASDNDFTGVFVTLKPGGGQTIQSQSQAVPEPATSVTFIGGIVMLLRYRRSRR